MDLPDRLGGFAKLGDYLKESLHEPKKLYPTTDEPEENYFKDQELAGMVSEARKVNPWFLPVFVYHSLREISSLLDKSKLAEWTARYSHSGFNPSSPLTVGVILAGNIPLVGFHDFLSVLISGHRFKGKMSGKDDKILPFLAGKMIENEPGLSDYINFEESRLGAIDAIIATGSNNSSRYFEYYFGKYPHIFRKNRNGVAILTGDETDDDLKGLADDIFLYFGMGCRNVSKIYVPEGYDFDRFYKAMEVYSKVLDHHKYANNYQYHRSVFLMNSVKHLDNGFLLLRADPAITSPVGSLHYEFYTSKAKLASLLNDEKEEIQCIAGGDTEEIPTVKFGSTQHPGLWDYADNVDTLKFLSNLYEN